MNEQQNFEKIKTILTITGNAAQYPFEVIQQYTKKFDADNAKIGRILPVKSSLLFSFAQFINAGSADNSSRERTKLLSAIPLAYAGGKFGGSLTAVGITALGAASTITIPVAVVIGAAAAGALAGAYLATLANDTAFDFIVPEDLTFEQAQDFVVNYTTEQARAIRDGSLEFFNETVVPNFEAFKQETADNWREVNDYLRETGQEAIDYTADILSVTLEQVTEAFNQTIDSLDNFIDTAEENVDNIWDGFSDWVDATFSDDVVEILNTPAETLELIPERAEASIVDTYVAKDGDVISSDDPGSDRLYFLTADGAKILIDGETQSAGDSPNYTANQRNSENGEVVQDYNLQLAPANVYLPKNAGDRLDFDVSTDDFILQLGVENPEFDWIFQKWNASYYPIMQDRAKNITYYNYKEGMVVEFGNGSENPQRIYLVKPDGSRIQNGDFGISFSYLEYSPQVGVTPLSSGQMFYIGDDSRWEGIASRAKPEWLKAYTEPIRQELLDVIDNAGIAPAEDNPVNTNEPEPTPEPAPDTENPTDPEPADPTPEQDSVEEGDQPVEQPVEDPINDTGNEPATPISNSDNTPDINIPGSGNPLSDNLDPNNPDTIDLNSDDLVVSNANNDAELVLSPELSEGQFPGITEVELFNRKTSDEPTSGNDVLIGTDGNDILVGGGGKDVLTGGIGSDIYSYSLGDGRNVISDAGGNTDGSYDILAFDNSIVPGRDNILVQQREGKQDVDIFINSPENHVRLNSQLADVGNTIEAVRFDNALEDTADDLLFSANDLSGIAEDKSYLVNVSELDTNGFDIELIEATPEQRDSFFG